jgi:hypothetical protein
MSNSIYLASIYRLTAVNFWESAKTLNSTIEKDTNGIPTKITAIPFYFLISHATELLLKSALLKRGFEENDLKKYDYRHNLRMLLKELQKKSVTISIGTVSIINSLDTQHKTHALRYTALMDDGKKTYWPPPSILFTMLDELLLLTRISTQGI